MSRQTLNAILIASTVLIAVGLALMATVMAGAFGPFSHFPFGEPFVISPLAWTLMIVAMVLGGLGFLGLITVLILLLVHVVGPRS